MRASDPQEPELTRSSIDEMACANCGSLFPTWIPEAQNRSFCVFGSLPTYIRESIIASSNYLPLELLEELRGDLDERSATFRCITSPGLNDSFQKIDLSGPIGSGR